MKNVLRAAVLLLLALVAAPNASAQTGQPTAADALRAQEMENFRKWRESIPDLEKRLYDRVKAVNNRVVRLTNIVVVGFALLLVFAPLGVYLVVSQVNAAPLPAGGLPSAGAAGAATVARAGASDPRALQRLQREHQRVMERQNEIRRLLVDVQGFLKAYEANLEDLNRDKARIDRVIGKCAAMVAEIETRMADRGDSSKK